MLSLGTLAASSSTFSACVTASGGSGGAVAVRSGNASLSGCSFTACSAGLSGGALHLLGTSSASMSNCRFQACSCNAVVCSGGAVYSGSALSPLAVAASTFTSASSTSDGGALFSSGALSVDSSAFLLASSSNGRGGAAFASGAAAVTNSTFASCSALLDGGAAYFGAALGNSVGVSTFTNCSTTSGSGGAIAGATTTTAPNSGALASLAVNGSVFSLCAAATGYGGAISAPSVLSVGNAFSSNLAGTGGAVALPNGGWLSETASTFSANVATVGGCVFLASPNPQQRVAGGFTGTTFSACTAVTPSSRGGAVAAQSASLTLTGCTFDRSVVDTLRGATGTLQCLARLSADSLGRGGSVYAADSSLTVSSSSFTSGAAGSGGALFLSGGNGALSVTSSTFFGNRAVGDLASGTPGVVGTLFSNSFQGIIGNLGHGGAVHADGLGSVSVAQTSFESNSAVGSGGALNFDRIGSAPRFDFVNVTNNSAGMLGGGVRSGSGLSIPLGGGSLFAWNAAGMAGGAAFLHMPTIGGSPVITPARPDCLRDWGACDGWNNTAMLYGPLVGTNITTLSVEVGTSVRTATDLNALTSLVDGYGQVASWWPAAVISVACAAHTAAACPILTGIMRTSYDKARQPVNTVLSGPPGSVYPLTYLASSPWLPGWSPSLALTFTVIPCRFLELYFSDRAVCDCVAFAVRNADGSCSCPGPTGATATSDACITCPPGTWSTSEFSFCLPCQPGLVAPAAGSASCVSCPLNAARQDTPEQNATSCACAVGYGGRLVGATGSCSLCPPDTFQSSSTNPDAECVQCPPNSATPPGLVGATDINFCKSRPGYYMPRAGLMVIAPLVRAPVSLPACSAAPPSPSRATEWAMWALGPCGSRSVSFSCGPAFILPCSSLSEQSSHS